MSNIEKKPRVVFTFVEAGMGHIVPATGISDAFESKYGDKCEVIRSYIFKEDEHEKLLEYQNILINDTKKLAKSSTYSFLEHYAAEIIEKANGGGGCGLDADGLEWYTLADKDYGTGGSPAEVIWRSSTDDNNTLETANFPPSLYGNGRVNPTQNLVDAFPMANGYPISETSGNYNAENPYDNRDPRLAKYIVYNGSKQGPSDTEIITGTYGTNTDVVNKESGKSCVKSVTLIHSIIQRRSIIRHVSVIQRCF